MFVNLMVMNDEHTSEFQFALQFAGDSSSFPVTL